MIKLEYNDNLAQSHAEIISQKLEEYQKYQDTFSNINEEYSKILNFIKNNLKYILIAKPDKLRKLIKIFIKKIENINSLKKDILLEELDLLNIKELKIICKIFDIRKHSQKNKKALVSLIKRKRINIPNHIIEPNLKDIIIKIHTKKIINDYLKCFEKFYDSEWDKIQGYSRYDFVKLFKLKSCPYCNRNYIFTVDTTTDKLRPEIDHFYPKSKYPFLALSFYNLIPSCQVCNHTKRNNDTKFLRTPYEINNNDFQFSFKPIKINENEINLSLTEEFQEFDTLFKLNKLYKQHDDIVNELQVKFFHEHTKKHFELLSKTLNNQLKFNIDEVYNVITCTYYHEKDYHKKPLSKLVGDIVKNEFNNILNKPNKT
jgi:5-methylcytosine-specific restriction endonuclease McrA